LSKAQFNYAADKHCIAGEALPYGASTYAWDAHSQSEARVCRPTLID
jgi:hypothetical protein